MTNLIMGLIRYELVGVISWVLVTAATVGYAVWKFGLETTYICWCGENSVVAKQMADNNWKLGLLQTVLIWPMAMPIRGAMLLEELQEFAQSEE